MAVVTEGMGAVVSSCRIAVLQRLASSFLVCLSFEAWLMRLRAPVLPSSTVRRGETLPATGRGIDGWRNVGDATPGAYGSCGTAQRAPRGPTGILAGQPAYFRFSEPRRAGPQSFLRLFCPLLT